MKLDRYRRHFQRDLSGLSGLAPNPDFGLSRGPRAAGRRVRVRPVRAEQPELLETIVSAPPEDTAPWVHDEPSLETG